MAYEKQTWQTGDVITQEKLNHIEDGIAGAGGSGKRIFTADMTGDLTLSNVTWTYESVKEAYENGEEIELKINFSRSTTGGYDEIFRLATVYQFGPISYATYDYAFTCMYFPKTGSPAVLYAIIVSSDSNVVRFAQIATGAITI